MTALMLNKMWSHHTAKKKCWCVFFGHGYVDTRNLPYKKRNPGTWCFKLGHNHFICGSSKLVILCKVVAPEKTMGTVWLSSMGTFKQVYISMDPEPRLYVASINASFPNCPALKTFHTRNKGLMSLSNFTSVPKSPNQRLTPDCIFIAGELVSLKHFS